MDNNEQFRQTIEGAKANFIQAKQGFLKNYSEVPEDKKTWAPSSTARSAKDILFHTAWAISSIHGMLKGTPFGGPSTAAADIEFREAEAACPSSEEALNALETHSRNLLDWMDTLTPSYLEKLVEAPFGLGSVPVAIAIGFPAMHTNHHTAQLEYLQTIYGDRVWH